MKQGLCFARLIGLRTFVGALCVLLVAVSGISLAQGTWVQKSNFGGTGRWGAVGFSICTKGYIGTGFGTAGNLQDFWEWDQVTNTWTQKANYGGDSIYLAVGFSIGNRGYIGTGNPTGQDFWEWNQATNIWTQKANFGGMARELAVGFSIGNKGYIGTGLSGSALKDLWEYDPLTDSWTQKANFGGTARMIAVGFSIGTKGYIGTGNNGGVNGSYYKDFWEWNQATNTWTQKANFPGAGRAEAIAFNIGNYGYIGGGTTQIGSGTVSDFWKYDPSANSWTAIPNFGGGLREMAASFSIGCYGYVATGFINDNSVQSDLWEYYDPTNSTCGLTVSASVNGISTICSGQNATLTASGGITYLWSTGATSNSISVSPSSTTNYSVIVTGANGCTDITSGTVTVTPYPIAVISPNSTICSGDAVMLNASGGANYLWSTGETTASIQVNPNTVTNYSVIVSNGNCSDTAYTSVSVLPSPTASVTSNISTPITYGQSATLTAGGGVSYNWNNGDNGNTITVSPTATTVYCVTATSPNNCSDTACVTVTFYDVCASGIYLPNAFSPNNDGENDFLQVYYENALCVTSLNIAIYNRWGEKVFDSTNPAFKWDGTNQAQGAGDKEQVMNTRVVTYYLKATLIDGKEISKKGNISLVR